MTFGEKLNKMRKKANLTQEDVSSQLGVSPQAVSKWENDLSCPDIMLLTKIAELYGTTVDNLLSEDDSENAQEENKSYFDNDYVSNKTSRVEFVKPVCSAGSGKKFLMVNVISQFGDKVDVKLPVSLIKSLKKFLGSIKLDKKITGGIELDLSELDFDEIFELVDRGAIGEIANIVTQNGDVIKVFIETEQE